MTESQVPFLCRAEVRHSAIPLQEVVRSCSVVNPSPTASSSMSLPQQLHDSPQDVALYNESPIPVRKSSRVYVQSSVAPVASVGPTTFRASSSVLTPPALRKSVSVDSFPHYSRELRVVRGQAPATSRNFPSQSRLDKHILAGRLRGESLSSPYTSNRPVDTDRDRYDPPTSDGRRSITKAYDVRSLIRGGDLPLPSRSHNHSTVLSTSSTAPTSPPSSRTPSQKRAATRPDSGGGNRRRSGSAGYAVPLSSKKIAINTQIPPIPYTKDIVLVVLGTPGCGKASAIRKGLSGFGLGEPVTISENPFYVRRSGGLVVNDHDSPGALPHALQVIKGEVSTASIGLPEWPPDLPPIDGVILCYDSTKRSSYLPIEGLLKGYHSMGLPVIVLGCKADLGNQEVTPADASMMLGRYDTGLIPVSITDPSLKDKLIKSFDYLLRAIVRERGSSRPFSDNRNPASPAILKRTDSSERSTPATSPSIPQQLLITTLTDTPAPDHMSSMTYDVLLADEAPLGRNDSDTSLTDIPDPRLAHFNGPTLPDSPTMSPLLYHTDIVRGIDEPNTSASLQPQEALDYEEGQQEEGSEHSPEGQDISAAVQQPNNNAVNGVKNEIKRPQWAHIDELLDKLLFLAVSGEDPTFLLHFLLTYRRFATPRSLLLAMQKRMRQLDNPSGDPVFACFAQMRICHLLETWIRSYPTDFAVKGALGALNALIKSIISKTHLLHYGSEFLPFLEQLPCLKDEDGTWALRVEESDTDSEGYNEEEEEEEARVEPEGEVEVDVTSNGPVSSGSKIVVTRERRPSLPLSKALLSPSQNTGQEPLPKQLIKDLVKLANEVLAVDAEQVARQITKQFATLFLTIKPRDWLRFTFSSPKKIPDDCIGKYNTLSNHLADWVVSLILCHDRPRNRARQVEKFVEIALKLRQMNNYSALRAFVAGINIATDDITMETFKSKSPEAAKNLMSWDVLLKQIRSHRAYRMALRNSRGSCIPALEVHIQDLIKAHEGNSDVNEKDATAINWGKYNMMGRLVFTVIQCQDQCRESNDYDFTDRSAIANLFMDRQVMSPELQESRVLVQDESDDGPTPSSGQRDIRGLRKLFFW